MPKAMVSIAVTQIAPGTIRHGVRLIETRMPRSGYPGRPATAEVQTSLQFLRATQRTETRAHRNSNAANPYQDAPAK